MGMISIYTYSSYILHILSTQSTQTNHIRRLPCSLPFPIFIASQYISCRFLAGVPFPRSRILFSPAPSVSAPVVPFSVMPPLRSFRSYRFPVSSGRLVMRVVSSFPVPSYRSVRRVVVPFFVSFMPGRRNGAPFLSARFLVSSLSHRGVRFPGAACLPFRSSSRCGVAVLRFVHRPVRRLVVAFRVSLRLVGRLVRRLVSSSCSPCRSLFLVRHCSSDEGVPASFRRRHRAECLVKATKSVACFLFYPHPRRFPQLRFPSWRGRGRCP